MEILLNYSFIWLIRPSCKKKIVHLTVKILNQKQIY